MRSLFSFAPDRVYPATTRCRGRGALLPHHFTLTTPKVWRYIFCGTFPKVTLAGRYPVSCSHGVRTFLCQRQRSPSLLFRIQQMSQTLECLQVFSFPFDKAKKFGGTAREHDVAVQTCETTVKGQYQVLERAIGIVAVFM